MVKKTVKVVAAVIIKGGRIFCAQRKNFGPLGLKWEFPGGKVELGETEEMALHRELNEELSIHIQIIDRLESIHFEYPTFILDMAMFLVTTTDEITTLPDHESAGFYSMDEMQSLDWAPADDTFVRNLEKALKKYALDFKKV